jgi:DNA-binding NarL/FixJ family response regulator
MTNATESDRRVDTIQVWIVEDNVRLRETLADLVDQQPDMRCVFALDCCEDFVAALDAGDVPDIVLMDIGLPGRSGIEGVTHVASISPATDVVMLTIHEEDDKVFEAICAGASGYLLKPSPPETIVDAIRLVHRGGAPINPYIARKILGIFGRLPSAKPALEAYGLTGREKEILTLLVDDLTLRRIAERLRLSYHTVDNHVRNIYRKLHVRTRSRAVAKALGEELI